MRATPAASGFTLIEILVVAAIIGMLGSFVLASAGKSKTAANSATIFSNIRNYELALENYAQSTNGAYPNTGGTFACLGGTTCMNQSNAYNSSPVLDAALAPYLGGPPLPVINDVAIKPADGKTYRGALYWCQNVSCTKAGLVLIEPGAHICKRGTGIYGGGIFSLIQSSDGTYTVCQENTTDL